MNITAWSAISPFGIGADAFRIGLDVRRQTSGLVPDFDVRAVLGKKGTRSMDRVTALSVAAVGALAERLPGPETGLVLGTTGSVQSTMDFTRSSLESERPFYVDPARFPNTVMNCAAGQCAIWHQLKGPNATIAGGRVAGLLALNYARRLQASGRAGTLLCGGAEEYSDARASLYGSALLGEGAAMLLLEPDARDGLAEVVALEFGVYAEPEEIRPALVACVRRALDKAGARPENVSLVAPGDDTPLADVFGDHQPTRIDCTELIGDAGAAAATFQVLAVLVADTPGLALVTAVDRDGTVGCALLRTRR